MATPSVVSGWQALPTRERLLEVAKILVLPAICLLPILLTLPFMNEPFDRDEGAYATIAQGLLRGDVPYRDYFDHKPPLIYVWYAFSFLAFGEGIVAPRLTAALVWSATALLVYAEASLLFSRRIALSAAALFALSSALTMLQASANTEAFMLLPLTASLYAATRGLKRESWRWIALAGGLGALAVLTKQVAVINIAALGAFCVSYAALDGEWRRAIKWISALIGGFAAVVAVCLLPFVLTGSLGDFIYANFTYNRIYTNEISFRERMALERAGTYYFLMAATPFVATAMMACLQRAFHWRSGLAFLVIVWVVASQAGVMLSGRAFPHYYVALLPPLAILAGWYVANALLVARPKPLAICAVGLALIVSVLFNSSAFLAKSPNDRHLARFPDSYAASQLVSGPVAARITALTTPNQAIYNYGRETQLYFYANRRPAIRFMYDRPFSLDPPTFDEAMNDLRKVRPILIVDSVSALTEQGWDAQHPAALREFLASEYEFVGRVEFADFYRLKGP